MRSPAHLRKPCGYCPKPIHPDQSYIKRGNTYYHDEARRGLSCWTKAKRRDPSLATGVRPPAPRPGAHKVSEPEPVSVGIDPAVLDRFVLREDYDLLMEAYTDQEKRLKRVEAVVDAQVKAIATYISSAPTEAPPVVPPARPGSEALAKPKGEKRELTEEQRRRRGDANRGKSRVGGEKPLSDVVPSLVKGRPVEGMHVQKLYTTLLALGYRVKNVAVVAAVCSALAKQHQIRRFARGVYGPIDGA